MDMLTQYVKTGNLEKVRHAIDKGDFNFDINWMDYDLLKTSLDYKHKHIAKFFIENNFRLNKNIYSEWDNTPLHLAVKLGWKDVVQILLIKGASTTVRENINYLTPIELSFLTEKYELTDLMLPFYKQCRITADTVNELINAKLDSTDSISIIHIAAARNCLSIVSECIESRGSINRPIRSDYFNWPQYTPLHFAVKFRSRETIEFLLKSGADFTIQDKNGNTPLHLAVMLQDESSINLILSHHKYTGKNPKNSNDLSHFHIACTKNDPKAVYGFLQCGVDINAKVSGLSQIFQEFTALHCAVVYQCTDVVKLLLAHGANKNIYSDKFLLDVYKTNNSELINLIFTSRNVTSPYIELDKNISSLHKACMQFSECKIKESISLGASINQRLPPDAPRWPGGTALHIAISYKHIPIIQLLLKNGADITIADVQGKTPLHLAFAIRSVKVIKLLLKHHSGLKVNPTDENGLSHFHIACASVKHSNDIIESFLQAGVDVNASVNCGDSTLYSGYTPLHMATSQNNYSLTTRLLEHGTDVTIKDGRGLTAFDYLFKLWNAVDFVLKRTMVMKAIAADEKSVAWFSGQGFTLLHMACILKDKSMAMRTIVDRDAVNVAIDFESRMYPGYTPLHFAVLAHDSEMISLLLDHGADPLARNLAGDTPLHLWKYVEGFAEDYDSRLFLLKENPFGRDGLSHFHIACKLHGLDIVRAFLDHGTDVDVLTKCVDDAWIEISTNHIGNETALHRAAAVGDYELALLLLSRGADVNARDALLRTPLHWSAANGSMMDFLLERGADVNAEKYNGFTPIQTMLMPEELVCQVGGDTTLETDYGLTPFGYYMQLYHVTMTEPNLWILLQHVLRLCAAGCYVSDVNLSLCMPKQQQELGLLEDAMMYERDCVVELERLAQTNLDKDTTLRDVVRKSAHQLRHHAVSEAFRSIAEDVEQLEQTYPIYGYLVALQYRRALKRRLLVEKAIPMMKFTLAYYLPADCVEEILRYFTDQELIEVLKNGYCCQ